MTQNIPLPSEHPVQVTAAAPDPDGQSKDLAMFLATEHWSLLGTRSMTWSEIMSRINIHLAMTSAALVVLALVAQATGFGPGFMTLAIGLTSTILVLGTLTLARVMYASEEDAHLVRGMNRLRAAYVDLAPELRPYLSASTHDDEDGLWTTYTLGHRRSTFGHIVASTAFYLQILNTIIAGVLGALVAWAAGVSVAGCVWIGVLVAVLHFVALLAASMKMYGRWTDARFPTPRE